MNLQEIHRKLWDRLAAIKPRKRAEGEAPLLSSRQADSMSTPEVAEGSTMDPATPTSR